MDFPVFDGGPRTDGSPGKWALSAGRGPARGAGSERGGAAPGRDRSKATTRSVLLLVGGVLLAVLAIGFVFVLPVLTGDSAETAKPSPAAATPTVVPSSASPSPTPARPSASAGSGEYKEPYYPPAPKPTTESPNPDDEWDEDGPQQDWDDDSPWWEEGR